MERMGLATDFADDIIISVLAKLVPTERRLLVYRPFGFTRISIARTNIDIEEDVEKWNDERSDCFVNHHEESFRMEV